MFSHNCEIDMINDLSLSLSFSSKTNKKNQNSIAKLASFSDIHLEATIPYSLKVNARLNILEFVLKKQISLKMILECFNYLWLLLSDFRGLFLLSGVPVQFQ